MLQQPLTRLMQSLLSTMKQQLYFDSPEATQACGESLGRLAQAPLLLGLDGEMGAGKTCWTQGFARGLGVVEPVTSPTFALMHSYSSPRGPLYHLDLYRLGSFDELLDLGFEEILQDNALVILEWAAYFSEELAAFELYSLHFEHAPPGRKLSFPQALPACWPEQALSAWLC